MVATHRHGRADHPLATVERTGSVTMEPGDEVHAGESLRDAASDDAEPGA